MEVKINPQFEALIPPLSPDEFAQLESLLLSEGIRDALVIARYPDEDGQEVTHLADGHNRYRIATRHGLTYRSEVKEFTGEDDVVIWMIDNQKGRRNLTDFVKLELAEVKAERLRRKGREKYEQTRVFHGNQHTGSLSIIDNEPQEKHNTRNEIAADLGWSTGKVAMGQRVMKEAPEDVKQAVRAGEMSISQAYKEIKIAEKKQSFEQDLQRQREDIEQGALPEISGLFNVISVDPPWPYGREYDPEGSRAANPYPEMSIEQIKAIELPLAQDSVILLWTTHAFLRDAFDILEHWGAIYKATMVWNKQKIGMGAWFRMQCEFCLVGIIGKPYWHNTRFPEIIEEPKREHSRKPDTFFELINTITAGRKLEYFSREQREGWENYGNEPNKF